MAIILAPRPDVKTTMTTNAGDASCDDDDNHAESPEDDTDSTVVSLTDLFDEMDRAAFKRVLDSREAHGESLERAQSRKG
jgi:hypothetical protein